MELQSEALKFFGAFGVCILILGGWIKYLITQVQQRDQQYAALFSVMTQMQDKRGEERERNAQVMANVANSLASLSTAVNEMSSALKDLEKVVSTINNERRRP